MTQVFIMHFVCSETDKPFKVRFERENDSALFTIAKAKRTGKSSPGERFNKTGDTQSSFAVNEDELNFSGFFCPWCNHSGSQKKPSIFIECGRCKKNICGGNSGRIRFRCRSSCGHRGFMSGSFTSYMGSLRQDPESKHLAAPQEKLPHSGKGGTDLIIRD